jgi:hypothetical protein
VLDVHLMKIICCWASKANVWLLQQFQLSGNQLHGNKQFHMFYLRIHCSYSFNSYISNKNRSECLYCQASYVSYLKMFFFRSVLLRLRPFLSRRKMKKIKNKGIKAMFLKRYLLI